MRGRSLFVESFVGIKGEEENKKKRRKRDREKVKKATEKLKKNHKTKEIHWTNCHIMVRQKNPRD